MPILKRERMFGRSRKERKHYPIPVEVHKPPPVQLSHCLTGDYGAGDFVWKFLFPGEGTPCVAAHAEEAHSNPRLIAFVNGEKLKVEVLAEDPEDPPTEENWKLKLETCTVVKRCFPKSLKFGDDVDFQLQGGSVEGLRLAISTEESGCPPSL